MRREAEPAETENHHRPDRRLGDGRDGDLPRAAGERVFTGVSREWREDGIEPSAAPNCDS